VALFKVVAGIDYRTSKGAVKRAEAGDTVDDLPAAVAAWMTECGAVEPVAASKTKGV
jgi:hypothetical protein